MQGLGQILNGEDEECDWEVFWRGRDGFLLREIWKNEIKDCAEIY